MLTLVIAYVSSAVKLLTETQLETLLLDARAFNATQGVTGVLLYHNGTFFQFLEGEELALKLVYDRITQSKTHSGIIELMKNEQISQRHFSNWHMGFTTASKSTIISLERANWHIVAQGLQAAGATSPGLKLLLEFWHGARRRFV